MKPGVPNPTHYVEMGMTHLREKIVSRRCERTLNPASSRRPCDLPQACPPQSRCRTGLPRRPKTPQKPTVSGFSLASSAWQTGRNRRAASMVSEPGRGCRPHPGATSSCCAVVPRNANRPIRVVFPVQPQRSADAAITTVAILDIIPCVSVPPHTGRRRRHLRR